MSHCVLRIVLLSAALPLVLAGAVSHEERISAETNLFQGRADPLAVQDSYIELSANDKAYWAKKSGGSLADKISYFDKPLETTTSVEVKLIGFANDGQAGVSLNEGDFAPYLDKLKSDIRTRVLGRTKDSTAEALPLQTEFYLRISLASHHLSGKVQSAIRHAVEAAAPPEAVEDEETGPAVRISYSVVDDILKDDFHKSELSYTIYILNPTSASHRYLYSYDSSTSSSKGCAGPLWVAADEYIWIDLTAGPTEYGPHSNGQGGILNESLPRVDKYTSTQQKRGLVADLVSVLYSACRHLLAPPLAHRAVKFHKSIAIRVIRISDALPDPYSQRNPGPKPSDELGLSKLQGELSKLQIGPQSVTVTYHDLPMWESNLASAVYYRALRSHTSNVMWRPPAPEKNATNNGDPSSAKRPYTLHARTHEYLDSDEMMAGIEDMSHLLMSAAKVPPAPNTVDELHFPVYIFDLQTQDLVLMDRHHQVVAKESAVVGVRTRAGESLRDFTCDNKMVLMQPHDITRPLLGALLESIWGIPPTHVAASEATQMAFIDHLWSVGPTPFGPFGSGPLTSFSQRDAGMRNVVMSHLNASLSTAKETLTDFARFGLDSKPLSNVAAQELDARWSVFVYKMSRAARTIGHHDFDKALYFALSAAHDVGAMHQILSDAANEVSTVLKCFQDPQSHTEAYLVLAFVVIGAALYARGFGAKQKKW